MNRSEDIAQLTRDILKEEAIEIKSVCGDNGGCHYGYMEKLRIEHNDVYNDLINDNPMSDAYVEASAARGCQIYYMTVCETWM